MGISKDLTEEDVKFRYINEAITSKGWSKDSKFMEQKVKFTDGKISLHGNFKLHYLSNQSVSMSNNSNNLWQDFLGKDSSAWPMKSSSWFLI